MKQKLQTYTTGLHYLADMSQNLAVPRPRHFYSANHR